MNQVEERIANRQEEIARVGAMLDRFACDHGASPAVVHDLHVALDEVLSNILRHGYAEGERGDIVVRLTRQPGSIVIEIEDRGVAFDPMQAPAPDLTSPLRERRVGGLGVHFVRNLVDELAYSRHGDTNRLRLVKSFG